MQSFKLELLVEDMLAEYSYVPGVKKEWLHWRDMVAPLSDDATDFCESNPLEIPFHAELFARSAVNLDM